MLIGMEAPQLITKHGVTYRKSGKEKAPDPLWIGRLDVVRTSGGQVLLPIATKSATERTVFQVFRRKVEDAASLRCFGSVEATTERA